jgi:hypothetical protein
MPSKGSPKRRVLSVEEQVRLANENPFLRGVFRLPGDQPKKPEEISPPKQGDCFFLLSPRNLMTLH